MSYEHHDQTAQDAPPPNEFFSCNEPEPAGCPPTNPEPPQQDCAPDAGAGGGGGTHVLDGGLLNGNDITIAPTVNLGDVDAAHLNGIDVLDTSGGGTLLSDVADLDAGGVSALVGQVGLGPDLIDTSTGSVDVGSGLVTALADIGNTPLSGLDIGSEIGGGSVSDVAGVAANVTDFDVSGLLSHLADSSGFGGDQAHSSIDLSDVGALIDTQAADHVLPLSELHSSVGDLDLSHIGDFAHHVS